MSYYVGDPGAHIVVPVTSEAQPPQPVDLAPTVRAVNAFDTTVTITSAAWDDDPAPTRDLRVPLDTLPAGLWSLRLVIDDSPDLFLSNVYIE